MRVQSEYPDQQRFLVLVVDDSKIIRESVQAVLNTINIEIMQASNGSQGVALFEKHHSNLAFVILDYKMPGMNGYEALRQMIKIDSTMKFILSTSDSWSSLKDIPICTQQLTYLRKPYTVEQLTNLSLKLMCFERRRTC